MNPEMRTAVWYAVFAAEFVRIVALGGDRCRALERALALADVAQHELEGHDAEWGLGEPGIRDPQARCTAFSPGEPIPPCNGDGHYLCKECSNRSERDKE